MGGCLCNWKGGRGGCVIGRVGECVFGRVGECEFGRVGEWESVCLIRCVFSWILCYRFTIFTRMIPVY